MTMDDTLYAALVAAIADRPHALRPLCLARGVPEGLLDAIDAYWQGHDAHVERERELVAEGWATIHAVQGLMQREGGLTADTGVWECSCWFRRANGEACPRGVQWLLHHFTPPEQLIVAEWFQAAVQQGLTDDRAIVAAVARYASEAPEVQAALAHRTVLACGEYAGSTAYAALVLKEGQP
jgi:hypothetical protein